MKADWVAQGDRDRNLLFGIFAAQLKGVRPEQIIDAGAAWAADPSRPLAERLVTAGAINSSDRGFLERLVDEAVRAHGGEAEEALKTLGGEAQVEQTFHGTLRVSRDGVVHTVVMDASHKAEGGPVLLNLPEEAPGRYSRISVYGRGGMGRVLLVHDEHMDRDVAMKELLPHSEQQGDLGWSPVGHTASLVARFLREARLTGLLEHPAIIPVYELGRRPDGSLYYTMKLVRGKTLLQAIRDAKWLPERLKLLPHFLNLCHAISYAHSRGVIHRDIKPANIMIGDFGETVVLDWGIAKAQGSLDLHETEISDAMTALRLDEQEMTIQTEDGEAMGTPHYMPPEQAEGRVADIDKRSDVYSLGAVLYELLTGKTPHTGRTTREILDKVMRERLKPVREQVEDAPPELAAIAEKCLCKHPEERYQSAKEVADEIERFLSGALIRTYKYSPRQVLLHYYRRHRAVMNTAMAGGAALLLLAVYSYVSISRAYVREQAERLNAEVARDKEEESRKIAEARLYLSCIQVARQSIHERAYSTALQALERAPEAERDWEWNYYNRLCHLDDATLTGHTAAVGALVFNATADLMATASDDKHVNLWNTRDWSLVRTLYGHENEVYTVKFSPDGSQLTSGSADGTARVWEASNGRELLVLRGHEGTILCLDYDRAGNRIVTASTDHTVRVWDSTSGAEVARIPAGAEVAAAYFYEPARLVVFPLDQRVFAWDLSTAAQVLEIKVEGIVRGGTLTLDGRCIFWTRQKVYLWDVVNGHTPRQLLGAEDIRAAFAAPDASCVAVTTLRNGAHLVSMKDGATTHVLATQSVRSAAFSEDGALIAFGLADNSCHLFKFSGEHVSDLLGHSDGINSVAFAPGSPMLITASSEGSLKVWNSSTPKSPFLARRQFDKGKVITVSPSGTQALVVEEEGRATVQDIISGKVVSLAENHSRMISRATFNASGSLVVTLSPASEAIVWDVDSGQRVSTLKEPAEISTASSVSPDDALVADASHNGTVNVWQLESGHKISTFENAAAVNSITFSRDSRQLLTASTDGAARLWNVKSGEREKEYSVDGRSVVISAGFSPSGNQTVTCAEDAVVRVWNTQTAVLQQELKGHTRAVSGACFNAQGTKLLSWSEDGTVRLWNMEDGHQLAMFRAADDNVFTARFNSAESRVLTAAHPGLVKVWEPLSGVELAALRFAPGTLIAASLSSVDRRLVAVTSNMSVVY